MLLAPLRPNNMRIIGNLSHHKIRKGAGTGDGEKTGWEGVGGGKGSGIFDLIVITTSLVR